MSLTEVWWLQQTEADVPPGDQWLSLWEADRAASFRIPKRRNDWRLGRWTAKCAVAMHLAMSQDAGSLSQIEVRPAVSGAPEVFISNVAADMTISLSHRAGAAICAVAAAGVQLGCDLELIEPHTQGFVRDYFTAEEQAIVDNCDDGRTRNSGGSSLEREGICSEGAANRTSGRYPKRVRGRDRPSARDWLLD